VRGCQLSPRCLTPDPQETDRSPLQAGSTHGDELEEALPKGYEAVDHVSGGSAMQPTGVRTQPKHLLPRASYEFITAAGNQLSPRFRRRDDLARGLAP